MGNRVLKTNSANLSVAEHRGSRSDPWCCVNTASPFQPKTSFSCLSVLWRSPAPFSIHLLIKLLLNSKEQSQSAENLREDPIIGAGVAVLSVLIRSVEDGDLRDTEDDRFTVPNAGELLLMGVLSHSFTSVSLGFNAKP